MNLLDEQGLKTGQWEEPDPHGGVVTGSYVAGERHGPWLHHVADGRLRAEFNYDSGTLTGPSTWYRATGGLLQKGAFIDEKKHGLWQRWTAAGDLLDEGKYNRGTKVGEWIVYNPDGSVKKRTTYRTSVPAPAE
ncbi:hypothetical protein [Cryobacterium sp. PH29-G1]|uniref:toxin-antitoxin system YwqK family antitoxin n=1 Tax=Cryobacterium sp. PH29-G1 TaxID=3046211 RepID=UPI0024BA20CF|nr:hypothetical protein [Cryobacterium sp. PH29-G1]MDJ0348366.1 hypothetical protein [Cryobacterium sp. PH29-G1]